jgi:ubiquitin carboxyl-terminal hydrolase 8
MGNCISDVSTEEVHRRPNSNDPFSPTNNSSGVVNTTERTWSGRGTTKNNRSVLRSIARVGSRVFRADPFQHDDSIGSSNEDKNNGRRNKRRTLEEHKASTYDHVHEIVNLGIETRQLSGKVGLNNMGNTCFMNTSLQCLSNTIPLTDYFLGYDYRGEINRDNFLGTQGALVASYAELIKHIWLGSDSSYIPEDFKLKLQQFAPQFEGSEQQDSQEMLAYLLDGIHEDLNRVKKRPYIEEKDCDGTNDEGDAITAWSNYLERNRSIIVDMFQGQLRNTMTCRNKNKLHTDGKSGCGHCNVKFDPFMYLSLPISDKCNTLDDCLQLYCEEELLEGDEQWYCPKCETHVDATKKIDLWMLPPILIIHLKRFKFSVFGERSKIDRSIRYQLSDWDLSQLKKSKSGSYPLYELYAISNHSGDVRRGHYTAHAKNRFDSEWYDYNDSQCRRINPAEQNLGHDPSAYCLFYNRVEKVEKRSGESTKRETIIRRQSVSRPELWPHLQRDQVKEWKSIRSSVEFEGVLEGIQEEVIKQNEVSFHST